MPSPTRCLPPLVLAAALMFAGPAGAQGEADFAAQFNGEFTGGGAVRTEASGNPWNVSCDMTGQASDAALSFNGRCRAALIVSRRVGAEIRIDGNGRYTGTYIGSTIGPAALSGRRSGNTVTLEVTWPAPVNGDTSATMTITATGNGFHFAVDDLAEPGGPSVRMTDITMNRR
ncbi:hypothetical protein [Devosia geojensis]|nr:hypothetical protein [Devosia geojensis]